MPTPNAAVDAFVASSEFDNATLRCLAFWTDALGSHELADITPDDVDAALLRLAERSLKGRQGKDTEAAGRPLSASTFNRYVCQLASLFKYARR
jgi:hypothetical protein